MNRVRDSSVLKQLRSVVGWEGENYQPARPAVHPQTSIEEVDLGKDFPYPFPFVDNTKDFLLSTLGGLEPASKDAYLHEKKQKLFKHARDKDHRDECNLGDLRAELRGLTPVQVDKNPIHIIVLLDLTKANHQDFFTMCYCL